MAKYSNEGYCPYDDLILKKEEIWQPTYDMIEKLLPYVVYAYGCTAKEGPYFSEIMLSNVEDLLDFDLAFSLFLIFPWPSIIDGYKIVVRDLDNRNLIPYECSPFTENDKFVIGIREVPEGVDPLKADDPNYEHHKLSDVPLYHAEVFIAKK